MENPDAAFAEVCRIFCPPPVRYSEGIHPTAVISESAKLGKGLHIGPHVVIEEGAEIGDGSVLLAAVLISQNARVGEGCLFHAGAVLRENVVVGNRVILHNHVVIGSDGFGYTVENDGSRTKVPQVGIVRLGDDVEIGAHSCVDRARFGETRIGNRVKVDNLVQIAHNVVIEDDVVLVSQVGISGSTVVKKNAILAGQVGVAGHLTIGEKSVVGAQGGVTKDVPPGTYVWGTPATEFKKYSKTLSNLNRLGKLQERVAALEAKLAAQDSENP
ncbi:MAG: UDP-3-O-(3-hydroxymyristoyl)glucosamine N-acyltransferase [Kiritimatiellia bacterium]